ncbi:MAG: hypothetical protein HQL52_10480 [Magnetococcales bacterium]|nr:hypothetical protein [Magnetococcales bacterium]
MMPDGENNLIRLRARAALDEVLSWNKRPWQKEALSLSRELPVNLRRLGLSVQWATLLNQGQQHHKKLLVFFSNWLLQEMPGQPLKPYVTQIKNGEEGLTVLKAIIQAKRPDYLVVQREAIAMASQVKLLADALYSNPEEPKQEKDHG